MILQSFDRVHAVGTAHWPVEFWQKQGLHSLLVGLSISEVPLYELGPDNKPVEVNPRDLFAGKLGILCGVPGAFTPVCTGVSPVFMAFMQLTKSFNPVTYQNT